MSQCAHEASEVYLVLSGKENTQNYRENVSRPISDFPVSASDWVYTLSISHTRHIQRFRAVVTQHHCESPQLFLTRTISRAAAESKIHSHGSVYVELVDDIFEVCREKPQLKFISVKAVSQ